jgi:glycosyltransferase involved in cell wall biosynthesis
MKITHVCLSLGTGGAEKILVDTLPIYKKLNHEVSIIQLSSLLEEKSYVDLMKKEGIPIFTLSTKGFFNPILLFKLQKVIKINKFDVVHVHLFPAFYYISCLKFLRLIQPKIVFTEHSITNGRIIHRLFRFVEPFIYNQFDAVVGISQNVTDMLVRYLPKMRDKIHLINNGVNIRRYQNAPTYNKNIFLASHGIPEGSKLLMMTSRFSDPKDQATVINSLAFLPQNYYLVLIGEGPQYEAAQILAASYRGRVKFLGFQLEVEPLMKMADVNILSSWHEGFSCVTLEGLASGKPFLGSNVTAVNEIVPDQRFLFEAGNARNLAQNIKLIFSEKNRADSMVEAAKQHVQKYDVQETIGQHIILYKQLLTDKI